MILYDYSKLRGRIVEIYGTMVSFSKAMNCSERILSLRMNSKVSWKQGDIIKACKLLKIALEDMPDYFFDYKVQNVEQEEG